jgi:hypothetical protein
MDSGFLDEDLYVSLEALSVGFIGSGKTYKATREKVGQLPEKAWKKYDNGRQCWKYASFEYKCDSWQTDYRALYTTPMYEDQQQVLEFVRPDNIIFTNLEEGTSIWDVLSPEQRKEWSRDDTLIASHHQRGADELPHRGLKDFAEEQLPFQNYASNQAYYYLMLVAFFLFECFKEDGLQDVLPTTSYARTIRRKFLDIAAKIVVSGRERVIKVSQAVMERLRLDEVLKRCQIAPIIQRI